MPPLDDILPPPIQSLQSPILYDSRFLPLFKKANDGCNESRLELYKVFSDGEYATPNYGLAKSFLDAMASCENYIIKIENQIEILEYRIFLEMKFDDLAGMKNSFLSLMDFLQEDKIPLRYWPHDTIRMMHRIFEEEDI